VLLGEYPDTAVFFQLRCIGRCRFSLDSDGVEGAGVAAGAAQRTALLHPHFIVDDFQQAEGTGRNAAAAAGAFIQVEFYSHRFIFPLSTGRVRCFGFMFFNPPPVSLSLSSEGEGFEKRGFTPL
jgi:hypothetical protein